MTAQSGGKTTAILCAVMHPKPQFSVNRTKYVCSDNHFWFAPSAKLPPHLFCEGCRGTSLPWPATEDCTALPRQCWWQEQQRQQTAAHRISTSPIHCPALPHGTQASLAAAVPGNIHGELPSASHTEMTQQRAGLSAALAEQALLEVVGFSETCSSVGN